jgi:hypothetical protein
MKTPLNSVYMILWHEGSKPELWNQQGRPLPGKGSEETPVDRQWPSERHMTAATFTCVTIELLEKMFLVRSLPRLYSKEQLPSRVAVSECSWQAGRTQEIALVRRL